MKRQPRDTLLLGRKRIRAFLLRLGTGQTAEVPIYRLFWGGVPAARTAVLSHRFGAACL